MILILSQAEDISTHEVTDWLSHYQADFLRVNAEEYRGVGLEVSLSKDQSGFLRCHFKYHDTFYDLDKVTAYWYRRGGFPAINKKRSIVEKHFNAYGSVFVNAFHEQLVTEQRRTYEYLHWHLERNVNRKIGSKFNSNVNKLQVLHLAASVGLGIPDTFVTSEKARLVDYKGRYGRVITKGIQEGAFFRIGTEDLFFTNYTEEVEDKILGELPETIFPSLLQRRIEKKYELRIFFLLDECYAMAIFSQQDMQTNTDFRKYNTQKPNRFIPYRLPEDIQDKIRQLMAKLELQTGSIDMVVTPENEYIFLEVNPVGQFGMTSQPCNYFLEKRIAKYLCHHE